MYKPSRFITSIQVCPLCGLMYFVNMNGPAFSFVLCFSVDWLLGLSSKNLLKRSYCSRSLKRNSTEKTLVRLDAIFNLTFIKIDRRTVRSICHSVVYLGIDRSADKTLQICLSKKFKWNKNLLHKPKTHYHSKTYWMDCASIPRSLFHLCHPDGTHSYSMRFLFAHLQYIA